jgi:uncharacterized RDD family membrane protein YckC
MVEESRDGRLRRRMRQSVRGARDVVDDTLDSTMQRVGQSVSGAARGVTNATAHQVIDEIEPYLVSEAVPRIVDGITPYLVDHVVPEILAGMHEHLVTETVPDVIDDVTEHLVAVTVPEVVAGITPRLVEELLPALLTDLTPYLTDDLVPQVVTGLTPLLEEQIAPQLVEAMMPQLENQIAPRLVDSLLPKIRRDVVPQILDDIVDDPRIRDLIREQSQGLFLDAFEALRENLADADDIAENLVRRLIRRPVRPVDASALAIVLADAGPAESTRRTWEQLMDRRRGWQEQPIPPAPPGREHAHAGVVTRGLAMAIDVSLIGWLVGQALTALLALLDSLFTDLPSWVAKVLTLGSTTVVPIYLALCWWLTGRTVGSFVMGTRVCTPDGRRVRFLRAMVRAWVGVYGLLIWLVTSAVSLFDPKRRTLLDRLLHTEVRYVVPDDQQRRYLRAEVERREAESRGAAALGDAGVR